MRPISDDDRAYAAHWAERIYQFHLARGDDMSNHFAENLTYQESLRRSLLAELAFGHKFGLQVNIRLLPDGDGGRDFVLHLRNTNGVAPYLVNVKAKTVRTSWQGLMNSGTHLRVAVKECAPLVIYVFGIYFEPTDDADVLRWDWGTSLIKNNDIRRFPNGGNTPCYVKPYEELRELDELRRRQNEARTDSNNPLLTILK